ncbi:MAG: hypothetical protein M3R36_00240 [Bacteroidota bacterium]|nr:hypothetical protein [Bacteroidota bacterium]
MNINLSIKRHEKKLEKLDLKLRDIEQSIKFLKKSLDKMNKPEAKTSTRKLSLIDRMEADNRLKNLMMSDFKKD